MMRGRVCVTQQHWRFVDTECTINLQQKGIIRHRLIFSRIVWFAAGKITKQYYLNIKWYIIHTLELKYTVENGSFIEPSQRFSIRRCTLVPLSRSSYNTTVPCFNMVEIRHWDYFIWIIIPWLRILFFIKIEWLPEMHSFQSVAINIKKYYLYHVNNVFIKQIDVNYILYCL